MTLDDAAQRCARAVKRLCDEHGAENSFTVGEVALEAGIRRMLAGKAMRRAAFNAALSVFGLRGWLESRDGNSWLDMVTP